MDIQVDLAELMGSATSLCVIFATSMSTPRELLHVANRLSKALTTCARRTSKLSRLEHGWLWQSPLDLLQSFQLPAEDLLVEESVFLPCECSCSQIMADSKV